MGHDIFSTFSSEELQSALANKTLRGMLDAVPIAIAVLEAKNDKHGRIESFTYTFVNKTADRMAGEQLTGHKIFLNDDPLLFNNMAEVVRSGQREDFLYHYQKDPEKWIHYSISRFDNGVMLAYENVTERKKSAIALKRERAQMAEAQSICNTGSFEWDLIRDKIYWSDEMYRIHGLEPQSEAITFDRAMGFVHPEDLLRIRKKIDHFAKMPGKEELLYKLKLPGGEIRHMRTWIESFRGKSGRITHLSGMAQDITDRRNTELELRSISDQLKKQSTGREKREAMIGDYGRIIESVHDAIISIDPKGAIVTWNAGAERLYGFTKDEAIGRMVSTLIIPENKQGELSAFLDKVFKNGESIVDFRTTKRCKDKSEIDVIVNIVPLKDLSGKVTGAAATSKSIDEVSHTDDAKLKEQDISSHLEYSDAKKSTYGAEGKYRNLIETIDEGFCVIEIVRDKKKKVVDWIYREVNDSFLALTGLKDPIGRSVIELIPDVEPSWFDYYGSVTETGQSKRFENYVSGLGKWYSLHASRIGDEKSNLVAVVFSDITQQKTNEELVKKQITEQNKLIESMTTATPDIMFVMDIESKKVLFATKNIAEVLGYSQAQIKKMKEPFLEIMHADDRQTMLDHVEGMKTAADGEVREIQYRMLHADGSTRWFIDRNTVFKRDENGVPTQKMGITHDIDARVSADQKIQQLNTSLTEKNRELRALANELKTFTTVAAYDYKDTLQNLYTNLEFIISRDAQNLSNTGKANLRKAQTAIQKMKLLTDDIVTFSKIRIPDENPTQVDLNETINGALDELSEKMIPAQPTIEKEKLPAIKGYPFLLDLLFYHLLDNAIKFRNPEVPLKISITHSLSKDKHTEQDVHAISIADNGIGLPQEEASKIFEMFYRIHDKKYKGSGIGLAICKKIADLHGGTMAVESEPGKGTTVCCFFPIS